MSTPGSRLWDVDAGEVDAQESIAESVESQREDGGTSETLVDAGSDAASESLADGGMAESIADGGVESSEDVEFPESVEVLFYANDMRAMHVAADDNGAVLFLGQIGDPSEEQNGISATGNPDDGSFIPVESRGAVVRLDHDGSLLWVRQIEADFWSGLGTVGLRDDGTTIVYGEADSDQLLIIDGGEYEDKIFEVEDLYPAEPNARGHLPFLAIYSPDGNLLEARLVADNGPIYLETGSFDDDGGAVLSGIFLAATDEVPQFVSAGEQTFELPDAQALEQFGVSDSYWQIYQDYVARFDDAGGVVWVQPILSYGYHYDGDLYPGLYRLDSGALSDNRAVVAGNMGGNIQSYMHVTLNDGTDDEHTYEASAEEGEQWIDKQSHVFIAVANNVGVFSPLLTVHTPDAWFLGFGSNGEDTFHLGIGLKEAAEVKNAAGDVVEVIPYVGDSEPNGVFGAFAFLVFSDDGELLWFRTWPKLSGHNFFGVSHFSADWTDISGIEGGSGLGPPIEDWQSTLNGGIYSYLTMRFTNDGDFVAGAFVDAESPTTWNGVFGPGGTLAGGWLLTAQISSAGTLHVGDAQAPLTTLGENTMFVAIAR